jgi:hypothetical protein
LEQTLKANLYLHSSFREKLLEHLFISELLKKSWITGRCDIEVAKSEVDSKGYDLIIEAQGVIRHIQFKSTIVGGRTSVQNINTALSQKPSGCVVWIFFDEKTLALDHFLFFGGDPGEKLPSLGDKASRHVKGNAEGIKSERPSMRVVKKSACMRINTFYELYEKLFGIA